MLRLFKWYLLPAVMLAVPVCPARAQYRYPGGYGGWGGWGGGGSTVQGSVARGMGVYAASKHAVIFETMGTRPPCYGRPCFRRADTRSRK